jgi:hypothetical protein
MSFEETAIRAFLALIGGAFLMVAIGKLIEIRSLNHPTVYVSIVIGLAGWFVAILWPRLPLPYAVVSGAAVVATDFRAWLGVVFLLWIYQAVSQLRARLNRRRP